MTQNFEKRCQKNIAVLTTILYIAIMGIGMFLMKHFYGYYYGDPNMVKVLVFVEVILTLLTIFVSIKFYNWKEIGFNKIQLKQLFWITPQLITLGIMIVIFITALIKNINTLSSEDLVLIGIICFTTFLVGFSEELMFRGILLFSFKKHSSISKSIFISAISFSLLHSVNVLGGVPILGMIIQLILTFIMGFCFAPLALRVNNLYPLIIFHWLWDFVIIAGPIISVEYSVLTSVAIVANLIIGTILWKKSNKSA